MGVDRFAAHAHIFLGSDYLRKLQYAGKRLKPVTRYRAHCHSTAQDDSVGRLTFPILYSVYCIFHFRPDVN